MNYIMSKRLYDLAGNLLYELKMNGSIESNSPKIRKFLYELLKKDNIKYKTTIIGYTSGTKSLCRWAGKRSIFWNLAFISKSIKNKRILKDDVESACEINQYYDFNKISSVFDENKTVPEIFKILNTEWGHRIKYDKWTPFDNVSLKKSIVRIELTETLIRQNVP